MVGVQMAFGSTPEKFRRAKGEPRDYRAEWLAWVERNPEIADHIERTALRALLHQESRIEVNALFSDARKTFHRTANQSYRAACADWLVEREPRLADLIERRKRKVTK